MSTHGLAQVPAAPAATDFPNPPAPVSATTTAPATAPPPDVVVLKNGARYRGTIPELVPGAAVTIVLVNGETRKLEVADVAYAGPASQEPATTPTPAAPTAEADEDKDDGSAEEERVPRVRFTANVEHVKFFYHVKDGYKRLCEAPCSRELPRGIYRFAARRNDGDELSVASEAVVDGPTSVVAERDRHRGLRATGAALVIAGAAVACLSMSVYMLSNQRSRDVMLVPALGGGVAFLVGIGISVSTTDGLSLRIREQTQK